ncbi:unnamed protein product [Arabidopsis lyrata]|uniref:Uncharacterized protein n=1 Tax=Arabidopsis lyrata subsp. lyrata TaxID=81972 RepID=D7M9A8_ARALL|nr:hypothetical protein ARALYDRAFT_913121 [Arabidopsis lyrata subsp. lyrata]CAH8274522.1 unnamed protein product [Arabidopsis lyrata]
MNSTCWSSQQRVNGIGLTCHVALLFCTGHPRLSPRPTKLKKTLVEKRALLSTEGGSSRRHQASNKPNADPQNLHRRQPPQSLIK